MNPYKIRTSPAKKAALLLLSRGQPLLRPASGKVITRRPTIITTSTMTGLVEHGLVEETEEGWCITEQGRQALLGPMLPREPGRSGRTQDSTSCAGRPQWC